jgi:hypothetical protein
MNTLEKILEYYEDDEFLKADGFDDAVIGVDSISMRLIYSIEKCVEILMKDEMTQEDALDYLSFNTINSYVGDQTPIFIYTFQD